MELLEVDRGTGGVVGHWPLGRDSKCGFAYTSKGELWKQECKCADRSLKLFSFDRENQKWQLRVNLPTFEPDQYPGLLVGADGEDLVFGNYETGMIRLRWVRPPATSAAPSSAASRE